MANNNQLMNQQPRQPGSQQISTIPDQIAGMARAEMETAVAFAMEHPRDMEVFMEKAMRQATLTVEIAQDCIYAKPVGDDTINGPSIRLAEIVIANYKHIRAASRYVGEQDNRVLCQTIMIDLENNTQILEEVAVSITGRSGGRFSPSVVDNTIAATKSKSWRNAAFKIVPRAFVDTIQEACRKVITGEQPASMETGRKTETLADQIARTVKHFEALGVPRERILARFGRESAKDLNRDDLLTLVGFVTQLKQPDNDETLDTLFPAPPKVEAARVGKPKAEAVDAEVVEEQRVADRARAADMNQSSASKPEDDIFG